MNNELQEKLQSDFPDIFTEKTDFYNIGDGWFNLVYDLSEKIHQINLSLPEDQRCYLIQGKEKFGGLRYYIGFNEGYYIKDIETNNITETISKLIFKAESISFSICEICGKPGKPSNKTKYSWIKTLCEDCKNNASIV